MSWITSYNTDYSFVALWRAYINTVSLQCNETAICVTTTFSEVFQFHKLFYIKSHIPSRNKHEYCSLRIFLIHLMILPLELCFQIVCCYKNVKMKTLRFGVPPTKAPLPLASSQFHFSSISFYVKKVRYKLR